MEVQVSLIAIRPVTTGGKLLALADVAVTWGDMIMEFRSIRVESLGRIGTEIRMPVDRDGRALVVMPEEVADAVAEVVLAGGLDAGMLKTRAIGEAATTWAIDTR